MTTNITPQDLTRTERSALLYAETTLVDYGGLMEGKRLNGQDHDALNRLQSAGVLTWGRVPAKLLGAFIGGRDITHWVNFSEVGWQLAAQVRRERCEQTRASSVNYQRLAVELHDRNPHEPPATGKENAHE